MSGGASYGDWARIEEGQKGVALGLCAVCCEKYEERGVHVPLILPCGHTLCKACVSLLKIPKKCPSCRTPFNTPVDALPHNFALLEMMAALPPPALPILKRSMSSMTDEEIDAYQEAR